MNEPTISSGNGTVLDLSKKHPLPKDVITEVRVRQFYKGDDNGYEVMPTAVFFLKDGKPVVEQKEEATIEKVASEIAESVIKQLPFPVKAMNKDEIARHLVGEITTGSATASMAKASLAALADGEPVKDSGVKGGALKPELNS